MTPFQNFLLGFLVTLGVLLFVGILVGMVVVAVHWGVPWYFRYPVLGFLAAVLVGIAVAWWEEVK